MEDHEIYETMEKINSLILYFSEVQIKLMVTKNVARDFDNHVLAAATTKAANGVSEIMNILQGTFEAVEKEAGITHTPIKTKKPNLTFIKGGQYEKD